MKIVILYSGGLDSKIMAKYAEVMYPDSEIIKVFYNIGTDYNWKEEQCLEDDVHKFSMPWFASKPVGKSGTDTGNIFIPGRNLAMSVIAACQYLPDEIWLGALQGEMHDSSTDKNMMFANKTSELLDYVLSPFKSDIKIRFPLADEGWGKYEATRWALDNGLEKFILNSSSCLTGEVGNCGHCVVCARRAGIFLQLGLSEKYNTDPFIHKDNIPMYITMLEGELSGKCHYDEFRRREIVPALKMYWQSDDISVILSIYRKLLHDET